MAEMKKIKYVIWMEMQNKFSAFKAAAAVFAILFLIFLSGCVKQPNDNLAYSKCCNQRDAVYECRYLLDANGNPQKNANGYILTECGSCATIDSNGIIKDANGNPLKAEQCDNNCNFKRADCTNKDQKNTCYFVDEQNNVDTTKTVAGICQDVAANPCIQNQCNVLAFGKAQPSNKIRQDAQGVVSSKPTDASGDTYLAQKTKEAQQQGLVGKMFEFLPLDAKTQRLLNKNGGWIVDSMRLGVGGTFSDYDRARFYMPSSDYYCAKQGTNSIVDRYTNYLEAGSDPNNLQALPLSQLAGDMKDLQEPRLSMCKTDASSGDLYYICTTKPEIRFLATYDPAKQKPAFDACNKACSWAAYKLCSENPILFKKDVVVSPPNSPQVTWQFVDAGKYWNLLQKQAYPNALDPKDSNDPRNFYKSAVLPVVDTSASPDVQAKQINEVSKQLAIPGPAGGKVFECTKNDECLSGSCSFENQRTSCFLKDGSAVDCGCRMISDCEREYDCGQYMDGSMSRKVCEQNQYNCKAAGTSSGPVIACDYSTDTYDAVAKPGVFLPGTALNGACPAARADGGKYWGVLDLEEFSKELDTVTNTAGAVCTSGTKDQVVSEIGSKMGEGTQVNVELGNIVTIVAIGTECRTSDGKVVSKTVTCCDGSSDLKCEDKFSGQGYKCCTGSIKTDPEGEKTPITCVDESCPSGSRMVTAYGAPVPELGAYQKGRYPLTTDEQAFMRYNWYLSHFIVPSVQPVFGDRLPAGKAVIFTSPKVGQAELEKKFPLIDACGMVYGIDYKELPAGDPNEPSDYFAWFGGANDQQRLNKAWIIKSFGNCVVDSGGMPLVQTYGMCEPCGTALTLAYQKVTNSRDSGGNEKNYCPSMCSNGDGCECGGDLYSAAPIPQYLILRDNKAGANTFPELGFMASKIAGFQSKFILPVLDLTDYTLKPGKEDIIPDIDLVNCKRFGTPAGDFVARDTNNDGHTDSYWGPCKIYPKPDMLIDFLSQNHSSAIVIAANMQSTDAKDKVKSISSDCPDCVVGLKAQGAIDASSLLQKDADGIYAYPQTLRADVAAYTGIAFDESKFELSPSAEQNPDRQNVKVLMLTLDFGKMGTDEVKISQTLNASAELSRKILQHTGWPTIWQITYLPPSGASKDAMSNQKLYDMLYSSQMKRRLSLSGVIGILLPPLDNAMPANLNLLPAPVLVQSGESVKNAPVFCAAQNGTNGYLHPQISNLVQRIVVRQDSGSCTCLPCTSFEIGLGLCTSDKGVQICADGNVCDGYDPLLSINMKCPNNCIRYQSVSGVESYCKLCGSPELKNLQTTCTAMRSDNKKPVSCCDKNGEPAGCKQIPNCDVQTVSLGDLANNVAKPDAPNLIAGLPDSSICCVKEGDAVVTYRNRPNFGLSNEPTIFPKYGANTTECGKPPIFVDQETNACIPTSEPPLPIGDSYWTCSTPQP